MSNSGKQGSILRKHILIYYINNKEAYINILSYVLNRPTTYYLMYIDDICCFAPSVKGLKKLNQLLLMLRQLQSHDFQLKKTKALCLSSKA